MDQMGLRTLSAQEENFPAAKVPQAVPLLDLNLLTVEFTVSGRQYLVALRIRLNRRRSIQRANRFQIAANNFQRASEIADLLRGQPHSQAIATLRAFQFAAIAKKLHMLNSVGA